jgi:outer membrane protein TolC
MAADFYSTTKGDFSIAGGHLPIYMLNPATGTYVPNVTMGADGNYILNQYADFPSTKMDYKVGNIFLGGVSLTQPLYMGGKITAAYKMATLGNMMASENIRLSEDQVIVNTDEAYILAVRAKELASVAESYKTLLVELQKNVDAAVVHGMKTRNDQLKVAVKLNEASLAIQKANNAYRLAKMNLCHVIALPLDSDIEVDSNIESNLTLTEINTTGASIERVPEHTILQYRTDIASQQVKLTKSDYLPNIALLGGYTYANGGELAGKKFIDTGSAYVGVTLKMPLITFGERSSKIKSARAKLQIAQLDQMDADEKLTLRLAQSINILEEAKTELLLTENSLLQAEENMKQSKQLYEVGIEPLSDYLDAQALWQKASANHIDARCQLLLSQTKYLQASGSLK